jgi:hypothetical protein
MALQLIPKKGTMWLLNHTKELPKDKAAELIEYIGRLEDQQKNLFLVIQRFNNNFKFNTPEFEEQATKPHD